MRRNQIFMFLAMFVFISIFSGCAYLTNRKNDALDIFDLGITTTEKPSFALYADLFGLFPIGVAHVDGKLHGLGRNRFGTHDFREHGAGYLLGGKLQHGLDNYDPQNSNDPPWYDTGLIGYSNGTTFCQVDPNEGKGIHPTVRQTAPKTLHLGWVGLEWGCRFVDMFDFLLGWTTLDISHDDGVASHQAAPEPKEVSADVQAK